MNVDVTHALGIARVETTLASAVRAAGSREAVRWPVKYTLLLIACDVIVATASLIAAVTVAGLPWMAEQGSRPPGILVVVVTGAVWLALLAGNGSRSPRVVGTGATEYRRVGQATLIAFATIALLAYLFDVGGLRAFLLVGTPLGFAGILLARWLARRWLVAARARGRMMRHVLLIGSPETVASVARDVQRTTAAGFDVVGACVPARRLGDRIPGSAIPVVGGMEDVPVALAASGADTVIVTSANEFSPSQVRELSWQLEPGRQHLIVAPSLTDIGGPRLRIRPVNGLPLVHIETPRYEGGKLYVKRAFDVVVAGAAVLVLAPVLAAIALIVSFSSPGPVLFRQPRVGLRGDDFEMLKFRSMYADAEERLRDLDVVPRDEGNAVMFKMRDDPRVTPIGRILRRYSLDELPQLFNVLAGSMSLVGPRPPLAREVSQYADHVHRRFLVKPGITGLWQVSGRSDLDWEETVRLDLFYVENWTLTGDLQILVRTARAVLAATGAY